VFRHWRELSISPAYELTLLRWEIQMQKNLGRSILDLITGLTKSAAKVRSSAFLSNFALFGC